MKQQDFDRLKAICEKDWVNVKTGFNPIHLFAFPLNELIII